MPRCVAVAAGLVAAALMLPVVATAQSPRSFPLNALRGELTVTQPPEVLLNGQAARLAPGARIRGENNLLVLSGQAVGQKLLVNYTLDPIGLVMDVWILTPAERAVRPWPTTPAETAAWRFDIATQTWTKP